jgi:hypothetical protein
MDKKNLIIKLFKSLRGEKLMGKNNYEKLNPVEYKIIRARHNLQKHLLINKQNINHFQIYHCFPSVQLHNKCPFFQQFAHVEFVSLFFFASSKFTSSSVSLR